ncbi:MAG TPA: SufD family Fe-S cluster assembly protein [Candidatus Limiplasma sp.]|nr:SufD family Fe-S cluster assembly protein [Candidatus Limiplasma sp.]
MSDLTDRNSSVNQLSERDMQSLANVGVLPGSNARSATMVVRDQQTACLMNDRQDVELLPIARALTCYDWLKKDYYFKAVSADYDDITRRCAKTDHPIGYFIRVKRGVHAKLPCQTAMYMATDDTEQAVHNIVILEEDARLELITGCVSEHQITSGRHLSVDEYYIGKNAWLTSTMVHSWGSRMKVYPRAGTVVEENGRYESNYISLNAAQMVQSDPQTYLNGQGANAQLLTVVLGTQGSEITTDGNVYLNAENTNAELLHRGVCLGGQMKQGGLIIANAPGKGHVDCAGMLLDTKGDGYIQSIPGLRSHHPDARLSHEASIGKIAPEQLEYLMSRGMEEMEAVSMLIRGFLGTDIVGLGNELDAQIAEIVRLAGHGEE